MKSKLMTTHVNSLKQIEISLQGQYEEAIDIYAYSEVLNDIKESKAMTNLVNKLKQIKDVTQEQYKEAIDKYAYNEVIKDLKETGIQKDDLLDDDFNELLQEKVKHSQTFAKGAMTATGALLFLELLG